MKKTIKKLSFIGLTLLTIICITSCSKEEKTKVLKINVKSISLNVNSGEMKPQAEFTLIANILPENADNKKIIWASQNEKIARVDKNGKITAISEGKTTITACSDDNNTKRINFSLTVKDDTKPITVISVESISLNVNSGEMKPQAEFTLIANILPKNTDNKKIIWISQNEKIALVDKGGKITAISDGKTTIKACSDDNNEKFAEFSLTVKSDAEPITVISVESVTITNEQRNVKQGDSLIITAYILPENASNKIIIWTSSNTDIATIGNTGKLKGIKAGKVKIKASTQDGNKIAECEINISSLEVPVQSITIKNEQKEIKEGENLILIASILPENASNKTIIWTSDNTDIATIDDTGKLQGIKAGKVKIKASTQDGSKIAECEISVLQLNIPLENISLNYTGGKIEIGDIVSLDCKFTPNNTTNKSLTWSSSNTNIATVSKDGKITFIGIGEVIIKSQSIDGNKTASYTLKSLAKNICYIPNEKFKKGLLEYNINREEGKKIDVNQDGEISYEEALAVDNIRIIEKDFGDVRGIEYFTNLKRLKLYDCKITSIDVSKLVNLTSLTCSWNKLTSIDVSKNTKLNSLDVYGNKISNLDISTCKELTYISIYMTDISEMDFSTCTKLTGILCARTNITSVDLSLLTELESFNCLDTNIKSLDFSKNKKLKEVNCKCTSINGNIYVFDKNLADTSYKFEKDDDDTWVEKR